MKPEVYYIKPTQLIPNSSFPLLVYRQFFPASLTNEDVERRFESNKWRPDWTNTYGPTQPSHYHTSGHESMVVLEGKATIRFGVSDDEDGSSALELQAAPGDAFVIPAGVAHKTFNPVGTFTMSGAYPEGSPPWNFNTGDPDHAKHPLTLPKPPQDPLKGDDKDGLVGLW